MIDNIIMEKQEKRNKRFKECVEKNGSQTAFAKALNEKYRKDEDKQISQPTISNWWNVGVKREGKATIGFPKFENMLRAADCLGVDIGYLIGETDSETFDLDKASKFMHLDPNAVKNFLRVTGGDELSQKYKINECSVVLNKLLCSKYLDDFIRSLNELENAYIKYNNVIPNFSKKDEADLEREHFNYLIEKLSIKYDEETLNSALKHQDIVLEEDDPFGLTDKERDAEKAIRTVSPFITVFVKRKSSWQWLREYSSHYIKEAESITKKYKVNFLKKAKSNYTNLTDEQKKDIKHFCREFRVLSESSYDLDMCKNMCENIEQISNLFPEDDLEKAWEHYKFCEAIKDINIAIDENLVFLYEFKREISYCRFLVQESLLLLLNDIYPVSIDLRNII